MPLLIAASSFVSSTFFTVFTVIHGYFSSNAGKILSKSSISAFEVHAVHISIVTGSCDAPEPVSTADGVSVPPAVHAAATSTNVAMAMSHRFMFVSLLRDRSHGP